MMELPQDIRTLENLIDQLELKLLKYDNLVESVPGISLRITDNMRTALHCEAAEAGMTLFEYINDLRTSLYRVHGKGGTGEDGE